MKKQLAGKTSSLFCVVSFPRLKAGPRQVVYLRDLSHHSLMKKLGLILFPRIVAIGRFGNGSVYLANTDELVDAEIPGNDQINF